MIRKCLPAAIALVLLSGTAGADDASVTTLRDAARQSVLENPEVLAAWREFQAASQEVRVARGGYYPSVDVEAGIGQERIDDPRLDANSFNRDRVSLNLSQMLFDGFATRNEVRRLDHAARTRYFEVLEISEQAAVESARAYFDVLRHRELVSLSEENYATHRMIYDQIERRVQAGISRRVDLEQAAGRLALSESNLLTDVTNLHDVSTRFQRIIGALPGDTLEEPTLDPGIVPDTIEETLRVAYANSPLMNASIANQWATEAATDVAKAAYLPKFYLQARQDLWHDREDISGRYEEGVVELVMRYNLFNGGSDVAERRRRIEKHYQAQDIRNKTCRDIRQDVTIAWNNTRRLEEQKLYLDRHQLSIEKAREAYRRQFDIGQRTLLDMLDTENEYYEARRAYLNAERDHAISYARTLAGTGRLVAALELGDSLQPMTLPPSYDEAAPDMYAICPQDSNPVLTIDKERVFREAMEKRGFYNTPRNTEGAGTTDALGDVAPPAPADEKKKETETPQW